ncbi:uncharacterized protein [Drosophila kikkawai]|nr:uncharacterized protein LOC108085437 [Drosophila kikkawai]
MMHCFCGTLMTVLKLKDICYLHWWQLMTLGFIIGGFFRIYLQPAKDGLGMGQTVTKYFILEYMLLTLLLVAGYTRVLRSQEEV